MSRLTRTIPPSNVTVESCMCSNQLAEWDVVSSEMFGQAVTVLAYSNNMLLHFA